MKKITRASKNTIREMRNMMRNPKLLIKALKKAKEVSCESAKHGVNDGGVVLQTTPSKLNNNKIERLRQLQREKLLKMEKTVVFDDGLIIQRDFETLIGFSSQEHGTFYYPPINAYDMAHKILEKSLLKEIKLKEIRSREIAKLRQQQREQLEKLEKSVVVEDNFMVEREFQKLIACKGPTSWDYTVTWKL